MNGNAVLVVQLLWMGSYLLVNASALAFKGRGNPLEAFLWSFKERPSFYNRPSINHFRMFSCTGRKGQLCLQGVTYSYMCPGGETFDMNTQECHLEEEVDCPKVPPTSTRCWHQPDGFYPEYEDNCASYYRCRTYHTLSCYNGSVDEEGQCDGSSIWDSATGSCGFGENVVCSPPSCAGLDNDFYPLPGSSCAAYYSCKNGFRTDMLCPYGTIFDYMKKQCVSSEDSVCYERVCENRLNGVYAEPRAPCNAFYRCFNGAMVQLDECFADEIFDGSSCVPKSNFSCWSKGEGSCKDRQDGNYSSHTDSQCRDFFVCKNQRVVRKFQCDSGFAFDGQKCVDAGSFICQPTPPLPDCSRKFDGYYTIENTECKIFFRCIASKKVSEHSCPGNHVFNGHQCVSPLFFACQAIQDPNSFTRSLPIKGIYEKGKF